MNRILMFALALLLAFSSSAGEVSGPEVFASLKKLEGTWNGSVMTPDGPAASVVYEVTSGGHAVIEKLFAGSPHEMVTIYTLDGDVLVANHYCHGNQPKMKLDTRASTPERYVFSFSSVTGLDKPGQPHIRNGWISVRSEDRIEAAWGMVDGEFDKKFFLTKAK